MDPSHISEQLKKVPYDQRWELLIPTIGKLYLDEEMKLSDVKITIETQYGFKAL